MRLRTPVVDPAPAPAGRFSVALAVPAQLGEDLVRQRVPVARILADATRNTVGREDEGRYRRAGVMMDLFPDGEALSLDDDDASRPRTPRVARFDTPWQLVLHWRIALQVTLSHRGAAALPWRSPR
jgi:hypothetical protein